MPEISAFGRPAALVNPLSAGVRAGGATPLARELAARIRDQGPITFAAFMEAALYTPGRGYYRRGRATVGREGDFLTSPEVHPLFGAAVAALAAEAWEQLGRPRPFLVREVAPGTGALAEAFLAWLHAERPACFDALTLELIEPSADDAASQRQRLASIGAPIAWRPEIPADRAAHLIVANELLDALPVHRLRADAEGWTELYVGVDADGAFADQPGPPSGAALIGPLQGVQPADGQIVEVCPGAGPTIRALARGLSDGLLLLFDYGYRRERLYASWRRAGTLMTFHRHTPGEDPYLRVGEQDLTCHVDIDTVTEAARAAGLRPYAPRPQGELLHLLGATALPSAADAADGNVDAYLGARRAVEVLADPAGLGRIQALAFARGGVGALPGLGDPEPAA